MAALINCISAFSHFLCWAPIENQVQAYRLLLSKFSATRCGDQAGCPSAVQCSAVQCSDKSLSGFCPCWTALKCLVVFPCPLEIQFNSILYFKSHRAIQFLLFFKLSKSLIILQKINSCFHQIIIIKGFDGHACLLRSMCEVGAAPQHDDGLFGDALNLILTASNTYTQVRRMAVRFKEFAFPKDTIFVCLKIQFSVSYLN